MPTHKKIGPRIAPGPLGVKVKTSRGEQPARDNGESSKKGRQLQPIWVIEGGCTRGADGILNRKFSGRIFAKQKKRAAGSLQGPIGVKVKNLQRGTAAAVELGGKPPCASAVCDMVFFCAANNMFLCTTAMREAQAFGQKTAMKA
ncbi:hypothetical protein LCM4573_01010 [Rhizobium sp. LCM 4573]|nr:hypothetical protein LCM4573_01010 [Rhizobium sp. LCM 4573]